ncbi:MAG: response regulator [Chromatiaceae bacterium]|nr:response regulator [Chromatiaceae bacterium]MBP7983444.1 response regulator [Chromatiaceae bacterium]MBP8023999.1 response regulator [Chromatiaceae bacterium]MBP9603166.1 response regulator [Chromatiaceae bacterium]
MRVLLIDDHALFRFGVSELLERRGIQVDARGDGEAGLARVLEMAPDVVLLDLRMPQMTGLEVLKRLRDTDQTMPVAMLTTSTDERDLIAALQAGAQGYLLKDMEPEDLITALKDILAGRTVVAKELTGILARVVQGGHEDRRAPVAFSDLTPREREILCHLAEGRSNKGIARVLGITDGTVKLHVKAILRKLAVHSRVEAAVIAVEKDLCAR